jgi:hypothetical protein
MAESEGGVGCFTLIGIVWAVLLSWGEHHDFFWALVAGFFNWFYVIYFGLTYGYWTPQ